MVTEGDEKRRSDEKSFVKALGFCGVSTDGNAAAVDVKNNKIVRIRPLHYDSKYSTRQLNPWKYEARGKEFAPPLKSLLPPISLGYKKRIFSPNRVLYPLKRVDWNPKGERNPQNRGKSGYIRITWDEALDLIVNELKRIKQTYGMTAVLSQSDGHGETKVVHAGHSAPRHLLDLLGGYTLQTRNPDSWEGWYWGAKHVWGMEPLGLLTPITNNIPDVARNSDLLLYWSCDPETNTWGWTGQLPGLLCRWFKELGIKEIYICPDLNYGAAIHADQWIPIRPNTDAALHLAIAYTWIKNESYDKEYIATHTFGFDKFASYVKGEEDGIAKTPRWAENITGVPARIIKALAKEWSAKKTSIVHNYGGSMIRGPYATEPARLEVCLLAMQGVGKPGVTQLRNFGTQEFGGDGECAWPESATIPDVQAAAQGQRRPMVKAMRRGLIKKEELASVDMPQQFIPKTLIPEAILHPPISWYSTGLAREPKENQFQKYTFPAEGCSEIHMIWTDTPCWITCWNNSNRMIQAFKSPAIEFVLAQHPWIENDCQYSDIILPVNTKLEERDIAADIFAQCQSLILEEKCIEPLGESKSDYEVVCAIAERMGLLKEYTSNRTEEEWIKLGFDTSGVAHLTSFEELKEKGYFVAPPSPNWAEAKPGLRDFFEDPAKNPLPTPSGKIEFYSENLARYFPDDTERPPVPHWIEKGESHDESLFSSRAQKYPLLIVSNHGRWRVHAQHDDLSWTREIVTCKIKGYDGYLYEPVWIHPADAAKRGIQDGDIIRVFNERGGVLGGARVWERIMPRVVYMDHGARYDPIIPGVLDRGGAINTITPGNTTSKNAMGMATSGFLVEVEKVDLDALRRQYPEPFNRPYDKDSGLTLERVLYRGESK